jgi:hypothetical protein
MSSLRSLLQDADPIRHEAPFPEAARDELRQRVLQAAPLDRTGVARGQFRLIASCVAALVVAAAALLIWAHGSTAVMAAVHFEVRLAEDHPIEGLVVARVADSGRTIYLHPEMVVSNDDIASSWVTEDAGDRFGVVVQLLPSGVERMRQATAAHVGRPLAILVDGAVVSAPVVRSPIGDSAVITGSYTRAEAERIVEGISRR